MKDTYIYSVTPSLAELASSPGSGLKAVVGGGVAENNSTVMRIALRLITLLCLSVVLVEPTHAQDTTTVNFYDQIKTYDLSTVLTAEQIVAENIENSKDTFERPQILGFIGDDFQRFYIHFISVIQNPTNPYEYLAYGKTKVKGTICSFQGTITIRQARIFKIREIPTHTEGFAICEVVLYEDKKQSSTGFMKGKLTSNFIIDNKGNFRYDGLSLYSDGFWNNQFVGTWISYKTKASKKCHWGDYRIPACGDLDIGAGQFSVDKKYIKNGWASYMLELEKTYDISTTPSPTKTKQKEWWE